MIKAKYLGIWMDHANAHLMVFSKKTILRSTLQSEFTPEEKAISLKKGEIHMHNKEQQLQTDFYHKIALEMINYREVLLFGPTDAKTELVNILKNNHHFNHIKIVVQTVGKLTENQQVAFVKNYFRKRFLPNEYPEIAKGANPDLSVSV